MKKILIALMSVAVLGGMSSCTEWLDVDADTRIDESTMFENGDGMRMALNGVYRNLASEELYGGDLTYGLASVLGCDYETAKLPSKYRYLIYDGQWYESYSRTVIDPVWKKAYNTLANVNNLLQAVEEKDESFFEWGKLERDVFMAELRGVRALIHFDMLRLFAPAPIADDGKKYIPYVEKYPDPQPVALTVKDAMKKIEDDLLYAQEVLLPYDTATTQTEETLAPYAIYTASMRFNGSTSVLQGEWFQKRGTRFNYYAATALLMRLYMWQGNKQKAADLAGLFLYKRWWGLWSSYAWTAASALKGSNRLNYHRKMYEDIIFAGYNTKMQEIWETKTQASSTTYYFRYVTTYIEDLYKDDADDLRQNLIEEDRTSTRWTWPEYTSSATSTVGTIRNTQMVLAPIIRTSEVILMTCEAWADTNLPKAIQLLQEFRNIRGAKRTLDTSMSKEDFLKLVEKEYCKEFQSDGQKYYYYKRHNKPVYCGDREGTPAMDYGAIGAWVLQKPLDEDSYAL